jgi:bifunctional non-homologous end joining protein LigD
LALPRSFVPQLPTLVAEPPSGPAWIHELKYDGYRIGCRIENGGVRLLSRNDLDWTARFPAVAAAARQLRARRAFLDGEVAVVVGEGGRTSFQALQNAGSGARTSGRLVYFVFDLLHLDGEEVSRQPLEERKDRLARLVGRRQSGVFRFSDGIDGDGGTLLASACRHGFEGIVSKRRDLPYQPGRGRSWLKTKCSLRQEFVIGGFTDPQGARSGIGALIVGVRERGGLRFAGKVGTGFTQASAEELRRRLTALRRRDSPFAERVPTSLARTAHWVAPELVAEVRFGEWTEDGKIRHASFQGLREDKPAAAIVRERPVPARKKVAAKRGTRPR